MRLRPARPRQAPLLAVHRAADRLLARDVEGVRPLLLAFDALVRLPGHADGAHAEVPFPDDRRVGLLRQFLHVRHALRHALPGGLRVAGQAVLEAQALGEVEHDGQVGARFPHRRDDAVAPLDVAVGVGHRAVLLVDRRRRQDVHAVRTVRQNRGGGDEGIDVD